MLEFFTLKPEIFGLDISDLSLKIIKLKKKRNEFSLASFGEKKIKPGIIKGGEIKDEKILAKIIKEAVNNVKGERIKTNYIIASLPEEKAFLQVIQMPRMSEQDLKSAIIYQAENYIPLPIEEVYLDFQIIPRIYPIENYKNRVEQRERISNMADSQDVLLAALPKKIVDSYVFCFKKAGLIPKILEIESLATARALVKKQNIQFPIALIDFGETRTSFIIFSGDSLRFTSSIPISSQKFTEAISQTMKIDLNEAEKLKLEYGLEEKAENSQVFKSLLPILANLAEQIKKYLDYYQSYISRKHFSSEEKQGVRKIFLCGGGANLKGLTDFLSQETGLSVEIGNPWINILAKPLKKTLGLSPEESLGYTTALGLALREEEDYI